MINKENRVVENYDEDIQLVKLNCTVAADRSRYTINLTDEIREIDARHGYKLSKAECKLLELSNDNPRLQDLIVWNACCMMTDIDGIINAEKFDKWLENDFDNSLFGMVDKKIGMGISLFEYEDVVSWVIILTEEGYKIFNSFNLNALIAMIPRDKFGNIRVVEENGVVNMRWD